MNKILNFLGVKAEKSWTLKFLASLVAPALILLFAPLGMNFNQCAVVSSLLLVITWWSAGIIKKIPASLFLLLIFATLSTAPATTVFSFPLSENFFLITLTYLFSQGISNSGLVNKLFQPVLTKYANTPVKVLLSIVLMFAVTMYIIPQPLARLIIVSVMFSTYLQNTNASVNTRSVLMYACFVFYGMVNMATRDADIIMNNAAVGFSGLNISDAAWTKHMAVPTVIYIVVILVLFIFLFRKDLRGISLHVSEEAAIKDTKLTSNEKATLAVIVGTVLLWMTGSIHGINATLITCISTLILFAMKVLSKKDFKAIDVTTLVFLTAAFSIGGVMKACGAAEIVFSQVRGLFPAEFSVLYIIAMVFVCMIMHMVLGSNTTTLSVVIPGLMILSQGLIPGELVVFVAIVSVSFHAILPFHSVALMIGNSNGYFPTKYVAKLGIPVTPIIYIVMLLVYLPWWHFTGLL